MRCLSFGICSGSSDAKFIFFPLEENRAEAERYSARVELTAHGNVGSVRADREALGYVIWNLLDNAVKYSPESPTVRVDITRDNGTLLIRVRDRGVGISKEDQRRIFQKFVRGESASNLGVPGTGIGLAVAREIMIRHGGDITVESEPGEGSTFTLVLPEAGTS